MGITSAALAGLSLASGDDSTTKHNPRRIFPTHHLDWSGNPGLSSHDVRRAPGVGQLGVHQHFQHHVAHGCVGQRHHQWRRTARLSDRDRRLGPCSTELRGIHGYGMDFTQRPGQAGAFLWDFAGVEHHPRRTLELEHSRTALAKAGTKLLCHHCNEGRAQSAGLDY